MYMPTPTETQLAQLLFVCFEEDARIVATKAKRVRKSHLDIHLLFAMCHNQLGVHTILGVSQVDGGVKPPCEHGRAQ